MSEFGQRVRRERVRIGMTAADLAKIVGISPQYLNDIELGRRDCPPLTIAKNMSDALGCELVTLDPMVRVPLSWVGRPLEEIETGATR